MAQRMLFWQHPQKGMVKVFTIGCLQEAPNRVIWHGNIWYFGKLVAEERWSLRRAVCKLFLLCTPLFFLNIFLIVILFFHYSVVFAGFSSEALASRINDGKAWTISFCRLRVGWFKNILQAYLYQKNNSCTQPHAKTNFISLLVS